MVEIKSYKETKAEKENEKNGEDETVGDIFDSLTDKQKAVVYALMDEAINSSDEKDQNEEDKTDMKHNVFDKETDTREKTLCHADQERILTTAKSSGVGSWKAALEMYANENNKDLEHSDQGFNSISTLFPEYQDVRPGAPELITTDQGWVDKVLAKVHKSPIS